MDVILLERIESLGQIGDVVAVKPGYARNYLLPFKKALRATKENRAAFEARKAQILADNLKKKDEAEAMKARLGRVAVAMVRQAGESGQLYGSVSNRDIAEAITAQGTTVGRTQIALDQAIKTVGVHVARLVLHPEVSLDVTVAVALTLDEAQVLLAGGVLKGRDDDDDDEDELPPAPADAQPEAESAAA